MCTRDSSHHIILTHERDICYCVNDTYKDYYTHVLATVYPGQLITPRLTLNKDYSHNFKTLTTVILNI